jgi:hypothetical protein
MIFLCIYIIKSSFRFISDVHRKLYQHSLECTVTLGLFLKAYPLYWCFVPLKYEQATIDDQRITVEDRKLLIEYEKYHGIAYNSEVSVYTRPMSLVHWCVQNVSTPPPDYRFSLKQIAEQILFFQYTIDIQPKTFLDLYNAAIVLACSSTLMCFYILLPSFLFCFQCLKIRPMICNISYKRYWWLMLNQN